MFPFACAIRVILFEAHEVRAEDRLGRRTPELAVQVREFFPDVRTATRVAGTYITTMKLKALSIFESR